MLGQATAYNWLTLRASFPQTAMAGLPEDKETLTLESDVVASEVGISGKAYKPPPRWIKLELHS